MPQWVLLCIYVGVVYTYNEPAIEAENLKRCQFPPQYKKNRTIWTAIQIGSTSIALTLFTPISSRPLLWPFFTSARKSKTVSSISNLKCTQRIFSSCLLSDVNNTQINSHLSNKCAENDNKPIPLVSLDFKSHLHSFDIVILVDWHFLSIYWKIHLRILLAYYPCAKFSVE